MISYFKNQEMSNSRVKENKHLKIFENFKAVIFILTIKIIVIYTFFWYNLYDR